MPESELFDVDIAPDQAQLVAERRRRAGAQGDAEELAEVFDRAFCVVRTVTDEARDRIHAVEQEVWADTRLQGVELRQRVCPDLPLPLAANVEMTERDPQAMAATMTLPPTKRPSLPGGIVTPRTSA